MLEKGVVSPAPLEGQNINKFCKIQQTQSSYISKGC